MFSKLVMDRIYKSDDILTVDIPIRIGVDYNAQSPIPIEFFMCMKSQVKAAFATHEHFTNFLNQVKADNLPVPKPVSDGPGKRMRQPDHLVVLAENDETANQIIDKNIGDMIINSGNDSLIELHITDQRIYNK